MTVSRISNQWVLDGNTERHAGSQRPPITSSGEDKHFTRMTLMDRAATSRALDQESGSFARQQVSAGTVRRRLQQHRFSALRPWLRLPLTLHNRQSVFNGVIKNKPAHMNSKMSISQINPGYSIKMVSVFGGASW
ncbi:HTH_Tnp_Tc3_2 domain-containing protein [Trichonephila clavipes]|uniref:HTH_Tnp_Tc3_2 domain-containing protein n=1 Tax=Trichonephila clavipes TaxID=2585209 RepID=A0A8X6RQG0_TRICX|nr:HTH_Tnp_Tc3_2 domain-containing protein [Trichonephila clavipes]